MCVNQWRLYTIKFLRFSCLHIDRRLMFARYLQHSEGNSMLKLLVIIGSLRKESINLKLARALDKLNHPNLQFQFLKIDDIPLYNQDLDNQLPPSVVRMKSDIAAADAVLLVTPEYNRSIPGVLKNIIDWGTRPYGQNVWKNKPCIIIGASISAVGSAVAQSHLRSIMAAISCLVIGATEIYITYKDGLIDDNGTITNEGTRQFLQDFLDNISLQLEKISKSVVNA